MTLIVVRSNFESGRFPINTQGSDALEVLQGSIVKQDPKRDHTHCTLSLEDLYPTAFH